MWTPCNPKARFIEPKPYDPFTPEQSFEALPVLLAAQEFGIDVLRKAH